jgi:metal-responsive CopG/Arc/MetJ family transcriptional regulator
MSTAKVAISLDPTVLKKVDRLVRGRMFRSRSQAIQVAIEEKVSRLDKTRLARECAKLNKAEERALAEEGFEADASAWPEY